jgi:phospholipid transport system substrate-binding protein
MYKPLVARLTLGLQLALGVATVGALAVPLAAQAAETAPDALVRQISGEVIAAAKADKAIQAGDIHKIITLVDAKVMPALNFEVMTRSAVGPQWRGATAEQRTKLQAEFKTLLVRVYAGALTQIKDANVEILKTLPVAGSKQVVVQSQVVVGKGEPVKLDYRMEPAGESWKVIDVNVGGIWLVGSYRSQFAQELNAGGIDNLIAKLVERNAKAAGGKG